MKKRLTEAMALFMICLVIAIPIYSAQAFAAVTAYSANKDGLRGYRAVTDTTTIVAEITAEGVNSQDVKLVTPGQTKPFTNPCAFEAGKSICAYEFAPGTAWWPGSFSYNVRYTGTSPYQQMPSDNSIIVDNLAPAVPVISIASADKLQVSYTIHERAFTDGLATKCSGIKRLNFLLAGQLLKTTELNFLPEQNCDYSAAETMDAPSTGGINKSFCIEAVDNVANMQKICQDVYVDREIPEAISNARIADAEGNPIEYTSPSVPFRSVVLEFDLDEHKLASAASITADASDFIDNEAYKAQQRNLPISCEPVLCEGTCACAVNALLYLDHENPVLKVHAADASGNIADLEIPSAVSVDSAAPESTGISSMKCIPNKVLGPNNNVIVAAINEGGSGLARNLTRIDLSSVLGAGYENVKANACNEVSAGQWSCEWGPFDIAGKNNGDILRISIVSPTQDIAGNALTGITSADFVYDSQAPEFVGKEIIASYASRPELVDYPVSGGTIDLKVIAKDRFSITSTADLSGISDEKIKTVECSDDINRTCVFTEIGPLYNGPFDAVVPVNITDCAGNIAPVQIPISVSALEPGERNYWTYSVVKRMPDKIDKQTLRAIPHKSFFTIQASAANSIDPILQELTGCIGEKGYLAGNLQNQRLPDLFNIRSRNPYAKFSLQRGIQPPDSVSYNCTIKTVSRTNTGFISSPELDNLNFTIEFYNSPLGTIDAALNEKMKKVKDSPLVSGDWIGKLDKVVKYLENICSIYQTLMSVADVINGVASAMALLKWTGIGIPAVEAVQTAAVSYTNFVHGSVGVVAIPLCKFVGCNWKFQEGIKKVIAWYQGNFFTGLAPSVKKEAKNTLMEPFSNFSVNPKDSLITSIATVCVPGVLHNLQKARQIDCAYVYCVQTEVSQGVPPFFCTAQRASQWCRFVWGEVFQLIPFANFIDKMIGQIKELITDPVQALVYVTLAGCISLPEGTARVICAQAINIAKAAETLANMASFVNNFKDSWKSIIQEDMCLKIK